jgi:SAM-dependent methyltransferase
MREIARTKMGFFPTQDRIVAAVAKLFKLPTNSSPVVILDAGCGTGQAIHDRRRRWLIHSPMLAVALLGIESDKNRAEQAAALFTNGTALWSAIEDAAVDQPVSLLYFNPPYDRTRGVGRTEVTLFNRVKDWPAKSTGLLLMIVPDYVLADPDVGLAVAVERDYELLGLWRYPEPEYSQFKQCVLLARRRDKALNKTRLTFPRWAAEPTKWPVLRDDMKPVASLQPVTKIPTLRRTRLGNDVIPVARRAAP